MTSREIIDAITDIIFMNSPMTWEDCKQIAEKIYEILEDEGIVR